MEKNVLIQYLSSRAIAVIASAQKQVETIGDDVRLETHILNAQYLMGKYHALMEVLGDLEVLENPEAENKPPAEWLSLADITEPARDVILEGIQKIYDRG